MTDSIVMASKFRLIAVNFWESAKKLDTMLEKRDDGSPAKLTAIPFYFLVSHAVELFLKSALLKRGHTEKDLKDHYGHNLNSLLKALQAKGVAVTPATVEVIDGLQELNENHVSRYDIRVVHSKKYWTSTTKIHSMLEELLLLTKTSAQGK
jgi:hypothetical protein